MAMIKRVGFGQVEANHLSAQRTGQIYAQLPCGDFTDILENGQFVKYNYADKKCDLEGAGEWMLVFNEVKLYDGWRETYKDFAMIRENYTKGLVTRPSDAWDTFSDAGVMTPRVFKTNVGDIYTTNAVGGPNTSNTAETAGIELVEKDELKVDSATGFLVKDGGDDEGPVFQVVKVYTMPDGQPAVKIMRIK